MYKLFLLLILVFMVLPITVFSQIPATAEYQIGTGDSNIVWVDQTVTAPVMIENVTKLGNVSYTVKQDWVLPFGEKLYVVSFDRNVAGKYYFRWRMSNNGIWSEYNYCVVQQAPTPIFKS